MLCKNCGAENAPESKFCVACGSTMTEEAVPVAPEVPVEPVAAAPAEIPSEPKTDANSIKDQLGATLKPVTDKVKPIFSNKKVLTGIIAGAVLLVVIALICGIAGSGNGFTQQKQYINYEVIDDEIHIIVDGKALSETVDCNNVDSAASSMDGKVFAFIASKEVEKDYDDFDSYEEYEEYLKKNEKSDLYVVKGKKLKKVAEDVYDFDLSVNGDSIAYVTREEKKSDKGTEYEYALTLYTVKNGKTAEICDDIYSTNIALSPDGKSICYFEGEMKDYDLMYVKGSKDAVKIASGDEKESLSIHGLSNNGKYIYVTCTEKKESEDKSSAKAESNLYCYNAKGESKKIKDINSSSSVYFNEDHTQVLFQYEDNSYIATKNKEAVKACKGSLSMVMAPNSDYASHTYPVSNLYNQVYKSSISTGSGLNYDYDYNLYLVKKKEAVKLASDVGIVKMDESGDYIYYTDDEAELRVIKVKDGQKALQKYTKLAEDVDSFVVTSNRKLVYYRDGDTLHSVNGKNGKSTKTICTDLDFHKDEDGFSYYYGIYLNAKDVCYYRMDGDLYACTNGKTGKVVLSDVENISGDNGSIIYIETKDSLYVSTGSKKPKKVIDLE